MAAKFNSVSCHMKNGDRSAAYRTLKILEKQDTPLAADLRKGRSGRFVLSVN